MRPKFPAAFELFYAVFEGSVAEVKNRLEQGDDPNAISVFGSTPIFYAVRSASLLPKADALFAAGARLDVWDGYGMQALHWVSAGWRDDTSFIAWLLDRGVNPNLAVRPARLDQHHPVGWTPLHIAAAANALPAIELLLSRGADPNLRAADGAAPLHIAASSGRLYKRLIRCLLDSGADMDVQQADGRTALHILAAGCGRYRKGIIQLLRNRNSRLDLLDSYGRRPIDVVREGAPATDELKRLLSGTSNSGECQPSDGNRVNREE
jgi:ankyrin repeat protein